MSRSCRSPILAEERQETIVISGRKMRVTALRADYPGKGHDRLLVSQHFLGVADGATPLLSNWPDPGQFSALALAALSEESQDMDRESDDLWQEAIKKASSITNHRAPTVSCSVAIARERSGTVEVSVLGDCSIAISTIQDDFICVISDRRIQDLDRAAKNAADPNAAILRNRYSMNTSDSYWIFSSDPRAAYHAITRRYRASDVTLLALYTDGLSDQLDRIHGLPRKKGAEIIARAVESVSDDAGGTNPSQQLDDIALILAT